VADLKPLGGRRHHDWDDDWDERQRYRDEDASQFGDDCDEYRQRIRKEYRPEDGQRSSWQCDRLLTIPKTRLATSGAYILEASANGQKPCPNPKNVALASQLIDRYTARASEKMQSVKSEEVRRYLSYNIVTFKALKNLAKG